MRNMLNLELSCRETSSLCANIKKNNKWIFNKNERFDKQKKLLERFINVRLTAHQAIVDILPDDT